VEALHLILNTLLLQEVVEVLERHQRVIAKVAVEVALVDLEPEQVFLSPLELITQLQ